MASVSGYSMAGMSDASGGSKVQNMGGGDDSEYDGSMYDGNSEMMVVKANNDMSYDDVNTSMAGLSDVSMSEVQNIGAMDESIGEYADTSMADLDDPQPSKNSGTDNMLASLRLPPMPENPNNDSKIEELKNTYRQSNIFDENEEEDYYDEEDSREANKRRSVGKGKLADLVKKKNKYENSDAI